MREWEGEVREREPERDQRKGDGRRERERERRGGSTGREREGRVGEFAKTEV